MQKRNFILKTMICMITVIVGVTGCNKNENPTGTLQDIENTAEFIGSTESDQYSYHGAKLTEMQRQNMGNDMNQMVETIIAAVNASQEQVDLSAYAKNSQNARGALQIAAYIDPIVEIAVFEADNGAPGVFKIDYGCSIGEHQLLVAEFNEKVEGIVNSCLAKSESDTEYAAAVFQFLVNNCQYDYENYGDAREAGITAKESALRYSRMSVYHVLMDGRGVCQQFTRAFSLLLQQRDIPVVEIAAVSNVPFASNNVIYNGKTEGELFGINHMWNLMQLSGKWYGADVTFAISAKEGSADGSDAVIYRYFGMSDETMQENFPSDISLSAFYRNMDIPSCEEELMLPEKEQNGEVVETKNISPLNGQAEKTAVSYEVSRSDADDSGEEWLIDFGENDAVYRLIVTLPEGYRQEETYPIRYVLGEETDREAVDFSSAICVKITAEAEGKETASALLRERDFSEDSALFLNRFLYGIMEAVEREYSVDTADRTLYGKNTGANMVLYILFQSDGLARDVFSHYICIDPNLYHTVGDRSLMAWETEYFQRCKEIPVLLTIWETDAVEGGQSSRIGLLKEIIKKREYRNLILEFS